MLFRSRLILGTLLFGGACLAAGSLKANDRPWDVQRSNETLSDRFQPPAGYRRVKTDPTSFGHWLRGLPLKPGCPPVKLYNGDLKENQSAHCAVVDIDVGEEDLQQCADAVIRLRAEYLLASDRPDAICFRFTSGDKSAWTAWKQGLRPVVSGNRVRWVLKSGEDSSYPSFRRYLTTTYRWAGTASLSKELVAVPDSRRVEIGDVFIKGGFPGHAVLVADVAQNAKGQRVFILLQSYMPAQEIHVLINPAGFSGPWYSAEETGDLQTPEWVFHRQSLKRFSDTGCP